MAIKIKSLNQFLGGLIRKLRADTPANDINTGSTLFSLLEAIAANDYENNTAILNVLELLNIDALRNNDLDAKAADFGLERRPAIRANGLVSISDSNITKRSTGLFPIKPVPIAGSEQLFVNDASDWAPTGELYIARGQGDRFEGPISYTSIVDNGTFYTINLASALKKDHLITDVVVDGQGTADRLIPAGTTVKIPSNNQSPAINYNTLRDAIIPAGEDIVENVEVIAVLAGSQGNAGINTITSFDTVPFTGAIVFNTNSFSSGRDIESDDDLRDRIKAFSQTLARGTKAAILESIIRLSNPNDNKQVASAVITEPVEIGDPSIAYIDDGGGLQPSYEGQSVDFLLKGASGDEEFLQLANFPLPRPQVVNTAIGPYELTDGMILRVRVDDEEETVTLNSSDFSNISSATLPEIVTKINDSATIFKARLTENSSRLLLYADTFNAEIIQVIAIRETDDPNLFANNVLKFPTNEFSHITLYKNETLLREKEKSAQLETTPFSTWNVTIDSNIVISVDGTPSQDRTFSSTDFGGVPFTSLSLQNWIDAFNNKFAGLQAEALSSGSMRITSNKSGSESSIEVLGGSLLTKWFADLETSSVGQTADFELNRQNGNLRVFNIEAGDDISAGVEDTKGALVSNETTTGNYNMSADANGRAATLVVAADASEVTPRSVNIPVGSTITISDEGSNTMRILSSTLTSFIDIIPTTNDYVYIVDRTLDASWIDSANTGLFKVIAKGAHTSAGVDTYIDVLNHSTIVPGAHTVSNAEDIQAFFSDAYPQIWLGSFLDNPPTASIQEVVNSLNNKLSNVKASIFKTNKIKLTSATEKNGSIAIPVSIGNAELLFEGLTTAQEGNPPLVANRVPSVETVTWFKRTEPSNTNVFFGRYIYSDLKGALSATAAPGIEGVDAFSDVLESTGVLIDSNLENDNIISLTKGNNEGHYRFIRQILSGDRVGTQFGNPRTALGHIATNDEFQVLQSINLSNEDNIVFILDEDSVNKTIDISLSRTGKVNSGSQSLSFLPTNLAFSADDSDNEIGVDFGTPQFWSKEINNTDFRDYKIWFRARNWYASGGVGGSAGKMLVRSSKYGPAGEKIRFALDYPSFPDRDSITVLQNNPFYTTYTYYFGSGTARTTNITGGTVIDVTDLGNNEFRYTFSLGVDLSSVQVGDIFSALDDSGISVSNRGQYRVNAVNSAARTIDIYNPNGAPTDAGAAEETDIETVADIVGSSAQHQITTVGDIGGSLDGIYFILNDLNGSVAFWIDVDDSGTAEPIHGAARSVKISTINTGDNDSTVASAIATVINDDPEFTASSLGSVITVDNVGIGSVSAGSAGTSGFTVNQTLTGVDPDSLDGTYIILHDQNGSVAFWFDVDATGTLEPIHGADRSVQISTVVSGDSANTVAGRLHAAINGDTEFTASVLGDTVSVTDIVNGNRPSPSAGTSGFTLTTTTNGSDGIPETITISTSVSIFPINTNAVSDVVSAVNDEGILTLVAIGDDSLTFDYATREERYTPAGPDDFSLSLSYDHDPDPTNAKHDYISLFDAETWVLDFKNSNPNFTLKAELKLVDVAPSVYTMDTAPNSETADTGEFFKLIPASIDNVLHHLTQKALSQLPIVSDVRLSNESKKVQIKSNELGSDGAIEVVGGQGNGFVFPISGDSESLIDSGKEFLTLKVKAFPDTLNPGDVIKLENTAGVQRKTKLSDTDSIDVVKISDTSYEYRFNPKDTFLTDFVDITISDVSASYGRPAGFVWRWEHSDGGSFFNITGVSDGAPSASPDDEIAAGGSDAPALEVVINDGGSISTPLNFQLTVSTLPTQADYFTFESVGGVTFAVWFDIDGNGTVPTGATYVAATNKIEVDILSTDSPNQIVSKLATTLSANGTFNAEFSSQQTQGATLADVTEGDILNAHGSLPLTWPQGNKVVSNGEGIVSGFPIVAVNEASRYIDVINPFGEAMAATNISNGSVEITPHPIVDWKLTHRSRSELIQVVVSGGVATATTSQAHRLKVGDTFNILNNSAAPTVPGSGVGTVVSVIDFNQFTYTTGAADNTYVGGSILDDTKTVTRYKIENLKFKNLMRISRVDGESPSFIDSGVAVDDLLILSGSTFDSNNNGVFRVRAVDDNSIVYENENGKEEVNTDSVPFNNENTSVNWISNGSTITGTAGAFENLSIGDSVKKLEDDNELFVQVLSFDTGVAATATEVTLNVAYRGSTSSSLGVRFDQENDVEKGNILKSDADVRVLEGDSVRTGDSVFIANIVDPNWFDPQNVGTFEITQVGTSSDYKPYLRVTNEVGVAETNKLMSINETGFIITEGDDNKFNTIREIEHIAIDEFDDKKRIVYISPGDRSYKFSESNGTQIYSIGKLNYSTDVTTGIDGYIYYTGILRTVQRTIDGFEPESETYPGRRSVGGVIEVLPPLIRRITVSIDVTTNEGVNLGEISNEIKSAIINYVNSRDVGEDVILSEIIARIMQIRGVEAATFNSPDSSTERISISDIEKASIESRDISIA